LWSHAKFLCSVAVRSLVEYVKDAVRLVASREMHVCTTFSRRFYWSDLNLWPEDLAPGSVVLLSGQVGGAYSCSKHMHTPSAIWGCWGL
jgi:hypothetical protein